MIPLLVQPISNEESTNILPVPWIRFHRCRFHGIDRLVELAAKTRIPAIYPLREFTEVGGLLAYSVDLGDIFRRIADLVDKILKGANPGDIPFFQPTKFELIINLKTAKALGLEMPPMLLGRADEVIE